MRYAAADRDHRCIRLSHTGRNGVLRDLSEVGRNTLRDANAFEERTTKTVTPKSRNCDPY
jgi:hypothetical protein